MSLEILSTSEKAAIKAVRAKGIGKVVFPNPAAFNFDIEKNRPKGILVEEQNGMRMHKVTDILSGDVVIVIEAAGGLNESS